MKNKKGKKMRIIKFRRLDENYFKIAENRIKEIQNKLELF